MRERLKTAAKKVMRFVGRSIAEGSTHRVSLGDLARIIQNADDGSDSAEIIDPVFYYKFLAQCCQQQGGMIRQVKGASSHDNRATRRFSALIEVLGHSVPTIPIAVAREIGRHADRLRFDPTPCDYHHWGGDAGLHFELSSSFAEKGRILSASVRVMSPENCLELGTAYGMSSLFVLSQLEAESRAGRLTTVEYFEPQFEIASSLLNERYADRVSCHKLDIEKGLPELAGSLGAIDLVFHDADHTGESYIRDFQTLEPHMAPGGVILFDDIRWSHPDVQDAMGCYAGWKKVVAHDRVRQAVEIDGNLGMLQLT